MKKFVAYFGLVIALSTVYLCPKNSFGQDLKWDEFDKEIGIGSWSPLFGAPYKFGFRNDILVTYKNRLNDRWSFSSGVGFGLDVDGDKLYRSKYQRFVFDVGWDYRLLRKRVFFYIGPLVSYGNWGYSGISNGQKSYKHVNNFLGIGHKEVIGFRITEKLSFNFELGFSWGLTIESDRDWFTGYRESRAHMNYFLLNRNFSTTINYRF